MSGPESRGRALLAWTVVIGGLAGALATARALHRSDPAEPNLIVGSLLFIPYIAAAMLLQITRKARLVIVALLVPALMDVWSGAWFTLHAPAWDASIMWRAIRCMTAIFGLPLALAFGLWMEKADARDRTAGPV